VVDDDCDDDDDDCDVDDDCVDDEGDSFNDDDNDRPIASPTLSVLSAVVDREVCDNLVAPNENDDDG
jgi:hypothetical protein